MTRRPSAPELAAWTALNRRAQQSYLDDPFLLSRAAEKFAARWSHREGHVNDRELAEWLAEIREW